MAQQAKATKKNDETVLATARERFQQALASESENRRNYIEDVRFSSASDQWTDEVKRMRGTHRPSLTFNRLNGVVKQLIGDYRQNKISIKVLPASGDASEDTADILAGIIRNIETQSNADMAYTNALECSARGGFGYYRILTEFTGDDVFDQDIVIRPIHNPLTVYMDPAARLLTREDARWAFVTELLSKEEFERLYPKANPQNFDIGNDWATEKEIRIAEYYEKVIYTTRLAAFSNGLVIEITDDSEIEALAQIGVQLTKEREAERTKILWRKMTGASILDEREYKIRYIPIVPVIGEEVNLEGKVRTRSAIFYAKDAQRMLNYQKTTATEVVALAPKAPWIGTPTHFEGFEDQWDNANNTPLTRLTYNPDSQAPQGPQRVQAQPQPIAEISLAGDAGVELQYTTGIFDANLGAPGHEVSGIAIGERQHQGATSTFIFVDNLKKAIEYGGRVILDFIPLVYDAERVVRVLDLEGNPSTEIVNQQQHNPMTGITEILNSITVGKYDVAIDTGPSFASRRRESQDAMMKLAQVYPQMMQVAGDLVVGTIDAPGMEAIAERIKRSMPPQITTDPDSPEGQQAAAQAQQQQAAQAQTQQQLVQAHLQTQQGKQQAEMAKSQASVVKSQAEVIKAKADVIEALHGHKETEAMSGTPQPIQPTVQTPQHPPIVLQMNADHALGDVASSLHGMAAHTAANTDNIAKMVAVLAHAMETHGTLTAAQTQMLHEVMQHTAGSHQAVAQALAHQNAISAQGHQALAQALEGQNATAAAGHQALTNALEKQHATAATSHQAIAQALERQNAIAAAPRKAIRDPHTRQIVGSEIQLPQNKSTGA